MTICYKIVSFRIFFGGKTCYVERMLNIEYYIGTIEYYKRELEKLPCVCFGTHRDAQVARVYSKNRQRYKEVKEGTKYWPQCRQIAMSRRQLKAQLKHLRSELTSRYRLKYEMISNDYTILNQKPGRFDTVFWNSLSDEKTSFENDNDYVQKGNHFRSRAEMFIATVLDEMGLSYRYDVKMRVNGRNVFVDFVVYLPQFDRCFLIEFFGKLNDPGYVRDNGDKVGDYYAEGIYNGQEIVFLCGNEHRMPPLQIVREQIEAMINGIACSRVIKATKN